MIAYTSWMGALLAAVLGGGTVTAAELPVTYLMPDTFTANLGGPALLRVQAGAPLAAEGRAWPEDKLAWFFVRAAGTQENRDTVRAAQQDKNAIAVQVTQPGVTVMGFDSKPVVVRLSGEELKAFLTQNVAGAVRDPNVQRLSEKQQVRVRRIESAATMVRVPSEDGGARPSGVAMSKTGQRGEIRPLLDPTMLTVGGDFPVKVYVEGASKAGAMVQATSVARGKTESKLADASGATYFRITHAGVWRIEFHHALRLKGDAEADWELRSATLTFEVAKGGAGK